MIGVIKSRFEKFYTFGTAILLCNSIAGTFFAFSGLVYASSDIGALDGSVLLDQIILFIIGKLFKKLMGLLPALLISTNFKSCTGTLQDYGNNYQRSKDGKTGGGP